MSKVETWEDFNKDPGLDRSGGRKAEYTETRTLRKSLTKLDIRNVAKQAFPGLTTGYAEQTEGMDVAGVLLVGDKHQSLWCKRGQERHMRQAFLETIQAAWRATQGDAK